MASAHGPQTVTLLGSTGSIGTQAEQVIRAHPERWRVLGLAAGGGNLDVLARQVVALNPEIVAVATDDAEPALREAIARAARGPEAAARAPRLAPGAARGRRRGIPAPQITCGPRAARDLAGAGAGIVLNAMAGSIGLGPTLAALDAGSTLALANKESLVAGGALVLARRRRENQIVPVDSEHSAIAQALRTGAAREVDRLVLTASGGPFRGWSRDQLAGVTRGQALAHPTWSMGPVVTVNSATMMNKALELIEAHILFGVAAERIDVVVHPQSIVHSMVTFRDGATIAQASPPDMRLPIAVALAWPDRPAGIVPPLTFAAPQAWTFEPLDAEVFPAVDLARAALAASGLHPAALNAANEVAVEAFLAGGTEFTRIVPAVAEVLARFTPETPARHPSEAEILAAEQWARTQALAILGGAQGKVDEA